MRGVSSAASLAPQPRDESHAHRSAPPAMQRDQRDQREPPDDPQPSASGDRPVTSSPGPSALLTPAPPPRLSVDGDSDGGGDGDDGRASSEALLADADALPSDSSHGGARALTTPAPSSSGRLTPLPFDDASTVYTLDDDSESASASANDLGSKAARRLDRAKRRLTDMEGNLSLARPPSLPAKPQDAAAAATAAVPYITLDQPPQQQQPARAGAVDGDDAADQRPGVKHTPPIADFVLARVVANSARCNADLHAPPRAAADAATSASPSKRRQRTTSLAGALMRRGALNQTPAQSPSNANATATATAADPPPSKPSAIPVNSQPARAASRDPPAAGSRRLSRAKPDISTALANGSSAAVGAESHASSQCWKPLSSRLYAHRSRSSSTMPAAGLDSSPSESRPAGAVAHKLSSTSIPCEPSYVHRSQPPRYAQGYHHRPHATSSLSTLSSRYRHASKPSFERSSRVAAMPTDPVSRAEQIRDLKDQVTDLKIKISTLKVKTQADGLRRRKDEHQYSKDARGRPSLFTDARQVINGNAFLTHASSGRISTGQRIKADDNLSILLGPVDRERIPATSAQSYNHLPLTLTESNQKRDHLASGRLSPLQELSSPQETGVDGPAIFWDPASQAQQPKTRLQNRFNRRHSPIAKRLQLAATNGTQDSDGDAADAIASNEQVERTKPDEQFDDLHSPGIDEYGFYAEEDDAEMVVDNDATNAPVDAPDQMNGAPGPVLTHRRLNTRNSAPAEYSVAKTLDLEQQRKGILHRASSVGGICHHRSVTWSDDLSHKERERLMNGGSGRLVRRSASAAIVTDNCFDGEPLSPRRAQSSTSHRRSKRIAFMRKHNQWSSDSASEEAMESDYSDNEHVMTPHEERADAFDYQNFLLHTATGDFAIATDSETSAIETDDGDDEQEQDEPDENESSAENDRAESRNGEAEDSGSDNASVRTAKGAQGSGTEADGSSTQHSLANPNHLAPSRSSLLPTSSSQESLSTTMTFETATEGRNSADITDLIAANANAAKLGRNASDGHIGSHAANSSIGSGGSIKYKFSSIRNASSPTVLIQPRNLEHRTSSRASSHRGRWRGSTSTYARTVDRGVQTSPERSEAHPAESIPPSKANAVSTPTYTTPPSKMANSMLRLHMETGSLSSLSSSRTADTMTSASASSLAGKAATTAATSPAATARLQGSDRPALGSPLPLNSRTVTSPISTSSRGPFPNMPEVVTSLISTAASRYAPPSVISNSGQTPESSDNIRYSQLGPTMTQMQDEDMARVSALLTSVGRLAFRLQLSLAEQESQWAALPSQSPLTPPTIKRPGTSQSNSSVRATHVLRERLEAAKRILDGRLEIPSTQK